MHCVRHDSFDYNGNRVTKGLPNAFVDSLTHDSIIVQIPRLHGQINTRLDKVLSIFDQSRKDSDNQQVLNLDDSLYSGDSDMEHIVRRLLMAATNADVRMDMNVEDEYYSVIEKRDTEILMRERQLAEQRVQLDEQNVLLSEQKVQLNEQKVQLNEQKAQLEQKNAQLEQKNAQMRASVQLMQKTGLSLQTIAETLNMTEEELRRLL